MGAAVEAKKTDRGSAEALIEVRNLVKHFPIRKGLLGRRVGEVRAVDDISFRIGPMETLGLVGESGCGKTTAGRTLLRLLEPTSGEAFFRGHDLFSLKQKQLRPLRRYLQIIFQDPYSSLNPRMTVENIVGDAMEIHGIAKGGEKRDKVKELLEKVGLQPRYITRYPHEFSGGQRQRIGIARALALNPEFIVCDEAVSALDVSIQAQVINLLQDLQEEFELSYLFIAHDLAVVRHLADRVAVMYLGELVEVAACDQLFESPAHPYTKALLSAIPVPDPRRKTRRIILEGDVPTPINPPSGCRFHTRCPAAFAQCREEAPQLTEVEPGHTVACHLYSDPIRQDLPLATQLDHVSGLMGLADGPLSEVTAESPETAEPQEPETDKDQETTDSDTTNEVEAPNDESNAPEPDGDAPPPPVESKPVEPFKGPEEWPTDWPTLDSRPAATKRATDDEE